MDPDSHPFLKTYYQGALSFRISGPYQPASIRDQVIRAQHLVTLLFQTGILQSDQPRVLVIGAGVAGAAAALTAAYAGAEVVMIDKAEQPFSLHEDCPTRFIDPFQYEWPHLALLRKISEEDGRQIDELTAGYYPVPVLPQPPAYITDLLADWRALLNAAGVRFIPQFNYAPGDAMGEDEDYIEVEIDGVVEQFDVEILAYHANQENCDLVQDGSVAYRGHKFWSKDPFEEPYAGLNNPEARVLISGGADGALQDLIRIVTGRASAWSLLSEIHEVCEGLAFAEEELLRAHTEHWLDTFALRHPSFDEKFEDQVAATILDEAIDEIIDKYGVEIRDRLLDQVYERPSVVLVHRRYSTLPIYPLNKYLARLFAKVVPDKVKILDNTVIDRISCVDPARTFTHPDDYWGAGWHVSLKRYSTDAALADEPEFFDGIVVRHGFKDEDLNVVRTRMPMFPFAGDVSG